MVWGENLKHTAKIKEKEKKKAGGSILWWEQRRGLGLCGALEAGARVRTRTIEATRCLRCFCRVWGGVRLHHGCAKPTYEIAAIHRAQPPYATERFFPFIIISYFHKICSTKYIQPLLEGRGSSGLPSTQWREPTGRCDLSHRCQRSRSIAACAPLHVLVELFTAQVCAVRAMACNIVLDIITARALRTHQS
jgi:hypothetical protein